ncbi:hypothetical protein MPSEU_000928600 [Mayamaea pseudoterrestris]|nr:hypothetical protein MPSEU_000928600 [Mayamaea pseudoterrestris]
MGCFKACVCCAYGPWIVLPAILALISATLTYTAVFGCSLFTSTDDDTFTTSGLWTTQAATYVTDDIFVLSCLPYDQVFYNGVAPFIMDASLKAGRVFGAMAATLAGPLWIVVMLLCCMNFGRSKIIFWVIMALCVVLAVLMLLMLAGMGTTYCQDAASCKIGATGILAIISFFLWLLTAFTVALVMKKEPRTRSPASRSLKQQPSNVETTETSTTNPDGTISVVTRTTTMHPDGSKEVKETTSIKPGATKEGAIDSTETSNGEP